MEIEDKKSSVTNTWDLAELNNNLPYGQKAVLLSTIGAAEFRYVDGEPKGFLLKDCFERPLDKKQLDCFLDQWQVAIVKAHLTIINGWNLELIRYV